MERLDSVLVFLAAFAVSFHTATPAPAQGAGNGDAPRSLFGEVIDVRVVNLEVVVTDHGEPVAGLGPRDFTLTIDGDAVPIDYFTEVRSGVAQGDESGVDMVPALAAGEPVGTSYLVFIDELFSLPARRDRVLGGIVDQLEELRPQDRMAVVAFDGKKFEVLSPWSTSVAEIEQVLRSAMTRSANGMRERAAERSALSTARGEADSVEGPRRAPDDRLSVVEANQRRALLGAASHLGLTVEEEQQVSWLTERVTRVVTAATAALRSFSHAPGRKVMLLMSGGWPDNPADWLLRDQPARLNAITSRRQATLRDTIYGPLIDTANLLGYSLYPIDVSGTSEPLSAVGIERATLLHLADQTGGHPMLAGTGVRALETTAADTRSYYWLGFVPTWKGDDEAHKIRVRVNRKGLEVRTRRNFTDLSRQRQVSMTVESLLRLGNEASPGSFPVRVGELRKAGAGKAEVLLQMLVPVSELTFLPFKGKHVAEVELRVAVLDEDGTTTDIPVVPLTIKLDAPPAKGEMQRFESRIKIRRLKHEVVVTFYDNASGRLLSTRLEVDPSSL